MLRSLNSGINFRVQMTKAELKDAIKLIKIAKKLGVRSMKVDNLEFELAETTLAQSGPALKVSKREIKRVVEKNEAQMDFDSAKDDLSIMHVEDPLGFEQALIENELDTNREGNSIEETHNISAE